MKISITLSILTSIFLFSCQKEADLSRTNGSGNGGVVTGTGTRLVKMVQKIGSDSLVTIYSYNGNNKLINLKKTGIDDQGDFVDREYHYHRNASGIITDYSVI